MTTTPDLRSNLIVANQRIGAVTNSAIRAILVLVLCQAAGNFRGLAADPAGSISLTISDVKPDGTNDTTGLIQRALDEAGKLGGKVQLPPGRYLVKGSLRIPPGVTLEGVMDSPVWTQPLNGSVILATGGRGHGGRAVAL